MMNEIVALTLFVLACLALAYVHIGYATLLMFLPSRSKRAVERGADDLPTVSIIIPAHNEEDVIESKLQNAMSLDYPKEKMQILVGTDNCTDNTVPIVERYLDKGVRLLVGQGRRGKPATVNSIVEASTGEILLFSDANVMFRPNVLSVLVKHLLEDRAAGCVSGNVILESEQSSFGEGEERYYQLERAMHENESRVGSMMGVDGGMFLIWRDCYQPPPGDIILDDFVISMSVIRQGRRIGYEGKAIAIESATPSATAEYRRRVRVSAGAVQSMRLGYFPTTKTPIEAWQYASHKLVRWLSTIWLLLVLTTTLYLSRTYMWASALVLIQISFYAIGISATLIPGLRRLPIVGSIFYFTMSHIALLHGLLKGLLTKQSGIWARTPRLSGAK